MTPPGIPCRLARATLFAVGTAAAACGGSTTSPSAGAPSPTPSPSPPSSPPVLSVPIVELGLVNDFLPFGFLLDSGRLNPAYELRLRGDTALVRAAGPGTVVNVFTQPAPASDSEIHIRPPDGPDYLVIYDHVVSLQVATGQVVAAGQVLGRVGRFSRGVGRVELQVNHTSGQTTLAHCPREFGTAEFNAAHDAAFARFRGRGASVCLTSTVQP